MWDTLSKGMIFRGSAQDLLTENHTSFKRYLMLGNPSPFLKKNTGGFHRHSPLHLQEKAMNKRIGMPGLASSLQPCG